jgi:hypothetical protein
LGFAELQASLISIGHWRQQMSEGIAVNLELIEREADECAGMVYLELTGGKTRAEAWYPWFLCERHGGEPLVDGAMPHGQIAYWDGEDIVVDATAPSDEVTAALPEELTHRLTSRETPRFEPANHRLRWAPSVDRATFQEMVGQRVAALFMQASR